LLEVGARVPADCILLSGQDLTVDESYYNKAENHATKKEAASDRNYQKGADPFLLSQTLVIAGVGKAVVAAVGKLSRRGVLEAKLDTESKTPLQTKLENLGGAFTKWGIYAALAILLANFVNFTFTLVFNEAIRADSKAIVKQVIDYVTLTITIIIVAVPEGLPLTVSLSLAYSVRRMKDD
jgi:magnesium-transporting ATPase (P-type)